MRCPKCGYLSFDSLASCRKCSRDLVETAEKLHGTTVEHEDPFFLGPTLGVAGEEEPEPALMEKGDLPEEETAETTEPPWQPEDTSAEAVTEETAEKEINLDALMEDLPVPEEEAAAEADFDLGLDDLSTTAGLNLEPEATEEEVEIDFDIEDSSAEKFSLETETAAKPAATVTETATEEEADIDFSLEGPATAEPSPEPESKKTSADEDQGASDVEELDLDFDFEDKAATPLQTEDLPPMDFEDIDLSDLTASKDSDQETGGAETDNSFDDLSSLALESDDDLADIEFLDTDDDGTHLTANDLASGLTLEKDE